MQTFLPYADFTTSARCLDRLRLNKQRVETKQILTALQALALDPGNKKIGWGNHPATKMWVGFNDCLSLYGLAICAEWRARGYKDTLTDFFTSQIKDATSVAKPWWLGAPEFHARHRAKLLGKNLEFYSQFNWEEEPLGPEVPYLWPLPEKGKYRAISSAVRAEDS